MFGSLAENFRQIKAETDSVLKRNLKQLFVRTEAAELIEQKGPYIFVGRKGSGKTALLDHFRSTNVDSYDAVIDIVADQEHSWLLYRFYHRKFSALHGKAKDLQDLKDVFDLQLLFTTAWAAAIQVAIMDRFLRHPNMASRFPNQAAIFKSHLKAKLGIDYDNPETNVAEQVHGILPALFEAIQVAIDVILQTHALGIGIVLSRITSWVTKALDVRLVASDASKTIKELLRSGDLRVLVTLDKYDDYVDTLVRTLDDKREFAQRVPDVAPEDHRLERDSVLQFQRNMLSGLLLATKELRENNGYEKLHYAFAVPQDRFAELRLRETAVFDVNYIENITWTPIHLLELFVRRGFWVLQEPLRFDSTDELVRQYKVLLGKLGLPELIQNAVVPDGKEDFLLYLIRHSMWRPRDLQRYLLEIFEKCARANRLPSLNIEELVHTVVNTGSQRIINDEFLIEYQVEYPRLAEVIDRLKNRPNILGDDELRNKILGSKTLTLNHHSMTTDEIIDRLYSIGFLGIRKTRNLNKQVCVRQHDQYIYYQFCYTDPKASARFSSPKLNEGEQWVVHPMFYDRLESDVTKQFVVHQLEWKSLICEFQYLHHIRAD